MQGINYASLFYGADDVVPRPSGALYIQNVDGDKDKDGLVVSYFPKARGIKTARYTLAFYVDKKNKELTQSLLFDDWNDPYQLHNLPLEEHPAVVKELCEEMGRQLKTIDDPWYTQKILSNLIPY